MINTVHDNAMVLDDEIQEVIPSDPQRLSNLQAWCQQLKSDRDQARGDACTLAGAFIFQRNQTVEEAKTVTRLKDAMQSNYVTKKVHNAALSNQNTDDRMQAYNTELNKKDSEIVESNNYIKKLQD